MVRHLGLNAIGEDHRFQAIKIVDCLLLQQVKKLLSSGKARKEAGLFVSDGTKLLQEAVTYFDGLETVILSDGIQAQVPDHVRVVRVPGDVMEVFPLEWCCR